MKIIKKFWGVALIVILLSSMFVGAAAPVSAANYDFSTDLTLPSAVNGLLGGFNFVDVAQSNDGTIYATTTLFGFLYKSPAPGVWFPVNTTLGVGVLVAVAPDNANIVAVVDTVAVPNAVWISLNGGTTFRALGPLPATAVIDSIDISALADSRYVAVGGYDSAVPPVAGAGTGIVRTWEIEIATSWVDPIAAALATVPPSVNTPAAFENCKAVAFSEGFAADQVLLMVNETINVSVAIDAYSFMFNDWNAGFEATFPRNLEVAATLSCARATIALDSEFMVGDNELGFIGLEMTDATGEVGGVFRINTGTPALTKIYSVPLTGNGINSVAWDGTNLMAGDYVTVAAGPINVFRCANALASSGWTFLPSSALKTAGTGTLPLVYFNGGSAYCLSSGSNAAVAKSTDLGKTFDGVALVSSNFNDMIDIWVSNDGTRMYALTDDGTDINVWSKTAGVWVRSAILAGQTGNLWMVRAAQADPNAVYLGEFATKHMYKALDGGAHVWTQRSCTQNIADFAVQSPTVVYVAVNAATTVVKTTTGGSGWLTPTNTFMAFATGGTCYSINLVAPDQLVVGGTTGGVSYSSNGATSWNYVASRLVPAGNTLATATTTNGVIGTGNVIFGASTTGAASAIGSWTIGTNTGVTGWDYDLLDAGLATADITGLVYANGILYAWDNAVITTVPPVAPNHHLLYRFINPAFYVTFADDILVLPGALAAEFNQAADMINSLQYSTGSTTLWARNSTAAPATADTLLSYTEYLSGTAVGPVPTYPINDAVISVNSISGVVNDFVFKWNCPPAISSTQFYTFDIAVFLDEAGTINIGGGAGVGLGMGGFASSVAASALAAPAFLPVAGTTYYWHVRTATPVTGYWSAMQKFNIQQLTAIVPVVTSPQNGAIIEAKNAAFSWNPIAGALSYSFQLDTGATFTAPLYSATVTSAGASLPLTINLEPGRTYFWRVKVLTPAEGEWSSVANFTIAAEVTTTTPVTTTSTTVISTTVTNTTITIPAGTTTVITVPPVTQTTQTVNPTYIWAIIIIGAVLVIAVIVLIVRTRRSV